MLIPALEGFFHPPVLAWNDISGFDSSGSGDSPVVLGGVKVSGIDLVIPPVAGET